MMTPMTPHSLPLSKNTDIVDLTMEEDTDLCALVVKIQHVSSSSTISTSASTKGPRQSGSETDSLSVPQTIESSSCSSRTTSGGEIEISSNNISRYGRTVKSTVIHEEYKASLVKKEKKKDTQATSRAGRTLKSTLVRINGHDVLAANNYVVKGGEYVFDTNSQAKPVRTSYPTIKKKQVEKKPRIKTAVEEKRLERVLVLKSRIKDMDTNRENFLSNHIPTLNPFLERKVIRQLCQVKERNANSSKLSRDRSNVFMQPDDVIAEMRDYQLEGLNWMIGMHEKGLGMILGDEMGLGKTLQTISLFCHLKETLKRDGPSLVICPLSVVYSWCNELDKWAPNLKYIRLHSSCPRERENLIMNLKENIYKYDAIITTYEMAKNPNMKHFWSTQYFNYVVLDEGHIIKNRDTDISQAVRRLHYENALILTGTPLQNNLSELWAILNFLSPTVFTTCDPFAEAFDLVNNIIHKDTLHAVNKVLSIFMLRRLKTEVEKLLPAKVETQVLCPLSKVQHDLYKGLLMKEINLLVRVEEGESSHKQLQFLVMQLRKCCNHPYLFNGLEQNVEDTSMIDLISSSGKLSVLDLLLRSLFLNKHRVVLFSQFTKMLDIIEDYCNMRGWHYCRFDGSTPRARRNVIVNDFNAPNSDKFIFLMSTRSGSMGLNLQTADTCILFDSDWNPQADVQAMARVHRIGQTKVVHVYRMVTGQTMEQRMVERAQKKLYLDKVVNVSSSLVGADKSEDGVGLSTKDMIADLKFGSDAIFGSNAHTLPSEKEIDVIIDRSRTEDSSIGNLKGGISLKVSNFDTTQTYTKIHKFEGVDFKKIREDQSKGSKRKSCGLAVDDGWQLVGKRQRSGRISMVEGKGSGYGALVPVLKSNNYDLETGEGSVFDRELAGRSKRENYAVPKKVKKEKEYQHQLFCQFCGYGGKDLIFCSRCPIAVHSTCIGKQLPNFTNTFTCTHHRCSICEKSRMGAGGVLYPCNSCPNSYCEDCLPDNVHRRLMECSRFEDLGYDSTKQFCYIHCSAQCEQVALTDLGWRPEHKKVPVCPELLDLAGAFH